MTGRYNIVIFACIDGFSRKIMYLKTADNNRSNTTLKFFSQAVEEFGYPLSVERLWRDLWMGVTSVFYQILHTLEEEGLLDLSSLIHLFFLPRLQASLEVFRERWDNHALRTEHNLTPNQLWEVGQMQSPIANPETGRTVAMLIQILV
ncbi:uncharacterized protein LOC143514855 [Brachyhypopomus gauderio]|uniref:uncharacterized protein LOC143514855 n=1 Tax=Brachyhypopomus gauderio TaxID=698409 RepID=UPI004043507A